MLHRKIYQLCCDGREVWIFLRDQQRWIERARILDIEGDLVTLRYETEEEERKLFLGRNGSLREHWCRHAKISVCPQRQCRACRF